MPDSNDSQDTVEKVTLTAGVIKNSDVSDTGFIGITGNWNEKTQNEFIAAFNDYHSHHFLRIVDNRTQKAKAMKEGNLVHFDIHDLSGFETDDDENIVGLFSEAIKDSLHRARYNGELQLASPFTGELLKFAAIDASPDKPSNIIAPPPGLMLPPNPEPWVPRADREPLPPPPPPPPPPSRAGNITEIAASYNLDNTELTLIFPDKDTAADFLNTLTTQEKSECFTNETTIDTYEYTNGKIILKLSGLSSHHNLILDEDSPVKKALAEIYPDGSQTYTLKEKELSLGKPRVIIDEKGSPYIPGLTEEAADNFIKKFNELNSKQKKSGPVSYAKSLLGKSKKTAKSSNGEEIKAYHSAKGVIFTLDDRSLHIDEENKALLIANMEAAAKVMKPGADIELDVSELRNMQAGKLTPMGKALLSPQEPTPDAPPPGFAPQPVTPPVTPAATPADLRVSETATDDMRTLTVQDNEGTQELSGIETLGSKTGDFIKSFLIDKDATHYISGLRWESKEGNYVLVATLGKKKEDSLEQNITKTITKALNSSAKEDSVKVKENDSISFELKEPYQRIANNSFKAPIAMGNPLALISGIPSPPEDADLDGYPIKKTPPAPPAAPPAPPAAPPVPPAEPPTEPEPSKGTGPFAEELKKRAEEIRIRAAERAAGTPPVPPVPPVPPAAPPAAATTEIAYKFEHGSRMLILEFPDNVTAEKFRTTMETETFRRDGVPADDKLEINGTRVTYTLGIASSSRANNERLVDYGNSFIHATLKRMYPPSEEGTPTYELVENKNLREKIAAGAKKLSYSYNPRNKSLTIFFPNKENAEQFAEKYDGEHRPGVCEHVGDTVTIHAIETEPAANELVTEETQRLRQKLTDIYPDDADGKKGFSLEKRDKVTPNLKTPDADKSRTGLRIHKDKPDDTTGLRTPPAGFPPAKGDYRGCTLPVINWERKMYRISGTPEGRYQRTKMQRAASWRVASMEADVNNSFLPCWENIINREWKNDAINAEDLQQARDYLAKAFEMKMDDPSISVRERWESYIIGLRRQDLAKANELEKMIANHLLLQHARGANEIRSLYAYLDSLDVSFKNIAKGVDISGWHEANETLAMLDNASFYQDLSFQQVDEKNSGHYRMIIGEGDNATTLFEMKNDKNNHKMDITWPGDIKPENVDSALILIANKLSSFRQLNQSNKVTLNAMDNPLHTLRLAELLIVQHSMCVQFSQEDFAQLEDAFKNGGYSDAIKERWELIKLLKDVFPAERRNGFDGTSPAAIDIEAIRSRHSQIVVTNGSATKEEWPFVDGPKIKYNDVASSLQSFLRRNMSEKVYQNPTVNPEPEAARRPAPGCMGGP